MALGFVFMAIGILWLPFRKRIARRQFAIASQMLGRKAEVVFSRSRVDADSESSEGPTRGLEMLGVFFCSVLIISGLCIVVLTLIFRPPWVE